MRAVLTELGYPEDADLGTLYQQMAPEGGSTGGPFLEEFFEQPLASSPVTDMAAISAVVHSKIRIAVIRCKPLSPLFAFLGT